MEGNTEVPCTRKIGDFPSIFLGYLLKVHHEEKVNVQKAWKRMMKAYKEWYRGMEKTEEWRHLTS